MVAVAVVHIVVEILVERLSLHLTERVGNGDNLMFGKLNGTSLMDVDMTRAHTDDTFVLVEHGVNGGGISLRATRQEEYLGIGHADSLANALFGALRELVEAVGCRLGIVVAHQVFKHLGVCPVVIIALKGNH